MSLVTRRLLIAFALMAAAPARAQPASYGLVILNPPFRREVGVLLRARITDPLGAPVAGASVLSARLDRADTRLGAGVAPVTIERTGEYGVYGFRTDLQTDGDYTLNVVFQPRPGAPPVSAAATFSLRPPARPSGG